jgi:SAM-dependent methyltransferase
MNAAREVVPEVLKLVKPANVADIGCGTGTWLKAFEEHGVSDYVGVDGDYIDPAKLKIPADKFIAQDLSHAFDLKRKFDLVVSLEVAEHISPERADLFIESLIRHSAVILFSAAVPGQGGQMHVNEQWPEYWQKKFERHGYFFHDLIRPLIWNNDNVDLWYRQNIFLIRKDKPSIPVQSLIHPKLFELKIDNAKEYYQSLIEGKQGLAIGAKIFFNAIKFKIRSLLRVK